MMNSNFIINKSFSCHIIYLHSKQQDLVYYDLTHALELFGLDCQYETMLFY
jgi:hypothetical protein